MCKRCVRVFLHSSSVKSPSVRTICIKSFFLVQGAFNQTADGIVAQLRHEENRRGGGITEQRWQRGASAVKLAEQQKGSFVKRFWSEDRSKSSCLGLTHQRRMAEMGGFEPPIPRKSGYLFSRQAPSTTRPHLQHPYSLPLPPASALLKAMRAGPPSMTGVPGQN